MAKPDFVIALGHHMAKKGPPGSDDDAMDDGGDKDSMAEGAMQDFIDAVKGGDAKAALSAYRDLCDLHEPDGDEGY